MNVLQEKVSVVCQEIFMLGLGIFETEVKLQRKHRQQLPAEVGFVCNKASGTRVVLQLYIKDCPCDIKIMLTTTTISI
jgi:hypothetical protein